MKFSTERHMQCELFRQIQAGKLKLLSEYKIYGDNCEGIEYNLPGKRSIDFLLEKKDGSELLIVELKDGDDSCGVCCQISIYIEEIRKKFPNIKISAMIIAEKIHDELKMAILTSLANEDVKVVEYVRNKVNSTFENINLENRKLSPSFDTYDWPKGKEVQKLEEMLDLLIKQREKPFCEYERMKNNKIAYPLLKHKTEDKLLIVKLGPTKKAGFKIFDQISASIWALKQSYPNTKVEGIIIAEIIEEKLEIPIKRSENITAYEFERQGEKVKIKKITPWKIQPSKKA